jgi:2OG-Fe(II) oxygenase superfamily
MKQLKDFIAVVKNGVPDNICDMVISEYDNSDEWKYSTVGVENVPNLEIRNVQSIFISQYTSSYRKFLNDKLFECARQSVEKYYNCDPRLYVREYSGFELLRYEPGGFYKEHIDESTILKRTISCSLSLNSGFEGGEWSFFDGEYELKTEKGDVVLFPSNFCFPHKIKPIISGKRYSVITWWT